ncbi:STAS domain-containing protein [Streptomyces katrae]|uniref:STAS domain-containing protein n=1 Tax=Streptomyces katrae TaxID=68223 RepID=UPI000695B715|nr:STAS domain-containing protein [Streptomyces katrae]
MSTSAVPETAHGGHGVPDEPMNVTVRREHPDTSVVQVTGEVDCGRAGELRRALLAALRASPGGIGLDLARAHFRDGSGLNALLDVAREAAAQHRPLRITAARPAVRKLLEVAGPADRAADGQAPGTAEHGTAEHVTAPPERDGGHGFGVTRARLVVPDGDAGHWVVYLDGSVEPHDRSALRQALAGADPGTPAYVIELGGLKLMTPAAGAVLADLGRTLSGHGRRLLLVGPHRLTGSVVQLSRTSGFVEFHAQLDRALVSACSPGPGRPARDSGPR